MKRMPAMLTLMVATVIGMCAAMAEPITVTDLLGRQVTLEKPAKRIVLSQGRHLQALALLHPDPVSLIAGWKEDYTLDSASYAVWKEKFPQVAQIPSVGAATDLSFSVEKAIGLEPDLVVFGLFTSEATSAPMLQGITSSFEKAGIPVVFVDFFVKPMQNTLPSVDILGKLIGREEQAAAFTAFYSGKLKRIAERIGPETERPKVFMQVHAAPGDCCNSPGRGIFDDFIVAAGGHNIGADVIPGIAGRISVEHLITVDPDIYVATGGAHMAARNGLVLGTGVDADSARESLGRLVGSRPISDLSAVANGRVYGVWHLFNDSPTHILLIEAMARWFHPELFADVDPDATLREMNGRFLALPLEGTYWIGQQ